MLLSLRLLSKTAVIVFVLSIYAGYLDTGGSFVAAAFLRPEYTLILFSIFNLTVGYGLEALNLFASYYAGKKYMLTKDSVLKSLLLLASVVLIGNTVGAIIAQAQFSQMPLLNTWLIWAFLSNITSPVLWSLVGLLAGNYKREANMRRISQPPAPPSG